MKVIKHIWRYLTDKDYRLKMYLTNLNRKKEPNLKLMSNKDIDKNRIKAYEYVDINQNKDD